MMRILIFSQHFYPENFRINEIAKWLSEKNYSLDVVTGQPNYPEGVTYPGYRAYLINSEKWGNINILRVPIFPRRTGGAINLALNYVSFIVSAITFTPFLLRKKKYDVVFCYATSPFLQVLPALFIAKIKSAKIVINIQDLWPESLSATGYITNRYLLNFIGLIVGWLYRRADLLLIQSKAFESQVKKYAPNAKVIYWPNSVDNNFLISSDSYPTIENLDQSKFNIFFTGNIGEAQAVHVILGLAINLKKYDQIKIFIFGDGSKFKWLKDQILVHQLSNIFLMGRWPIDMMPGVMRLASVLLLTLANQDIFSATIPNKLQAYLAVGRPILAAINGEGANVISDSKAGFVVPAESIGDLTSKALLMAGMTKAELELMGSNGISYFLDNFKHDNLMFKLVDHFHSLFCEES